MSDDPRTSRAALDAAPGTLNAVATASTAEPTSPPVGGPLPADNTDLAKSQLAGGPSASAALDAQLPDRAEAATLDSVRRAIHEMADELETNLGRISGADSSSLAEPLERLSRIVATRRAVSAPAATNSPAPGPAVAPPRVPVGAGLAAVTGWFVLFAVGTSISSLPFVEKLERMHQVPATAAAADPSAADSSHIAFGTALGCIAVIVATSTFTNAGILACLAAYLGSVSRRLQASLAGTAVSRDADSGTAAAVRGFFLYVAGVAGLLLLTTAPIKSLATQDQYVQLAGMLSALAFVVGYDPDFFFKLMARFDGWAKDRTDRTLGAPKQ